MPVKYLIHKLVVTLCIITATFMYIDDSHGQTIGYKEGPNITITKYNPFPSLGYAYGFFYDCKIFKDFGISTGLQYSFFKLANFSVVSIDNYYPSNYSTAGGVLFKVIELPLDITIKIAGKDSSDCQLYLTSGYSYCYILKKNLVEDGIIFYNQEEALNSLFIKNIINYAKVGLELRLFSYDKINFALGFQYKYLFANYNQYANINNWAIFVKTGFNLSKLKYKANKH
jgi:hypothetical protein